MRGVSFAGEALGTGAGATSGAGAGTEEEDVVTEGAGAGTPAADHRKSLACSVIGALQALIAAMHPVSDASRSVSALYAGTTTCAGLRRHCHHGCLKLLLCSLG